jgi:branched-chain amino acid transport system substrate-binding protein
VGAVVAVLAGGLAACGSATTTTKGLSGKTLKFGAVFSLTGAGGVYGPQQKNAVEMAQDDVNRGGGVNGAKVRFDIQDDGSDKSQSAQVTQRLIQEQALALLGPTLSNSAVAAHPLANNARTPMLAVSTTGLDIVGHCPYPCDYIFRDSLGEADAIPANIKAYADSARPKTGVLLYPNDDKFSADGAEVVRKTVGQHGLQLLDSIQFTKNEADLSPYVTRGVRLHPDVVFITSLGGIPAKIMIEARNQGFTGQFLGGNGFNTSAVAKQAGEAGKGAQSASAWYLGNDFRTNADFVGGYRARFGTDPDQFAAQAYTGVLILVDAAKRANLATSDLPRDRTRLKAALEKTNIDTPLGPFQFTSGHDVRQTIWIIAMDGKEGFTLVTSVKPS